MNYLLFCFALSMGFNPSTSWVTDFEKAKSQAGENHKWILLSFSGSDWCIPCMKMETQFFENAGFIEFADKHLVLVKADFPRLKKNALDPKLMKQNEILADRYNPEGIFPYTVLLNAEGKTLWAMEGLPRGNVDDLIQKISELIHL